MTDACPTPDEHQHADEASPELVIITGMSGAGRSEAMHTFEDLGFFCIDNLPPSFIRQLVDLAKLPSSNMSRLALVSDVRGHEFFDELAGTLDFLKSEGVHMQVLFLDAGDEVLLRRFKETRRRHPMCEEGQGLAEGIAAEREVLMQMRDRADTVIDTSDLRSQELRHEIRALYSESFTAELAITVYSFGFKHSVPPDADIVIDVRFLPNPHYNPILRPLTGLDRPVSEFVMNHPETAEFLEKWLALLDTIVPGYVVEGKQHLAIALGCTGGMHRSVALAEATAAHLQGKGYRAVVSHRDIGRDRSL